MEAASAHLHAHEHHGPPPANSSSRVEPQLLGMLLFIISEIMVFGAFFTAYFFIRVVSGDQWFPIEEFELPKAVAGVNTGILLSSSITMHWALESAKRNHRMGLRVALLLTLLLGSTFLFVQINEYINLTQEGLTPSALAQASVFYGLTGLHGAHVFIGLTLLLFATIRAFRGHYSPAEHRGVEVPGIYWHFVDVMWIFVFSSVYLLQGAPPRRAHTLAIPMLRRLGNPIASEAAAFRWLMFVAAVVAVIVALVLLARAIF